MDSIESTIYEFDCYQLNVRDGILLRNGEPVPMQWKAFETLCVLVRSGGRLVPREELIEAIWPDSFVEENNLSQQIRALRKLLANGEEASEFIETVPRRGYRFIPPVAAPAPIGIEFNDDASPLAADVPAAAPIPFSGRTVETETPVAASAPGAWRRSFSRKAVLITVICLAVVSVLGVLSWRNRPRSVTERLWRNAGERSFLASATIQRIGGAQDGVISPDGKRIVYTTKVAGKELLWFYQVASGRAIQIGGPNDRGYGKILFSGDGEYVYYSAPAENRRYEIYRIPMVGGEAEKLAEEVDRNFTLSPENTHIAAVTRDPAKRLCNLVTIELSEGTVNTISTKPHTRCFGALAWSPSGKVIAASVGNSESGASNNEVVWISVDGQEERSLTSEKWVIVRDIVWLSDRRSLLLAGRKKDSDFLQIWHLRRSTGEVRQVSNDASNYSSISLTTDGRSMVAKKTDLDSHLFVAPAEKPDQGTAITEAFGRIAWLPGKRIVYTTYKQDTLWSIRPDGTGPAQLSSSFDGSVATSPDGKHIYSVSAEGGSFHIWRMDANGSNRVQFTRTKEGEQYPAVSPDNRWVYYDSISAEGTSIRRMPVRGGSSQAVQPVGASRPSLSPDGRMLAFVMHGENGFETHGIGLSRPDGSGTFRIEPVGRLVGSRIEWAPGSGGIYYAAKDDDGMVNIWHHPLNGTQAERITNFISDEIFDFSFAPDRSRIAYVRGNWIRDLVKIDLAE